MTFTTSKSGCVPKPDFFLVLRCEFSNSENIYTVIYFDIYFSGLSPLTGNRFDESIRHPPNYFIIWTG